MDPQMPTITTVLSQPQYVSNKVDSKLFDYVEGFRNHLAVLKNNKSFFMLKKAVIFLQSLNQNNQTVLFVNNNPKLSFLTKKTALQLSQPYSNEYWIPGLLTNWSEFQPSIESFQNCEHYFGAYLKKKKMIFPKYLKQKKKLEGLTSLKDLPAALVLFQVTGNEAILKEAQLLNIPVVALTDCSKTIQNIDYPVPLNTESFSLIYFFCSLLCKKN
jgi:small subunit ribosomal protein S2